MKLLGMLTVDLPALSENTVISLRMLTHHYERCTTYYSCSHPEYGIANDEEKKLTMILFTRLFDSLAQRVTIIIFTITIIIAMPKLTQLMELSSL